MDSNLELELVLGVVWPPLSLTHTLPFPSFPLGVPFFPFYSSPFSNFFWLCYCIPLASYKCKLCSHSHYLLLLYCCLSSWVSSIANQASCFHVLFIRSSIELRRRRTHQTFPPTLAFFCPFKFPITSIPLFHVVLFFFIFFFCSFSPFGYFSLLNILIPPSLPKLCFYTTLCKVLPGVYMRLRKASLAQTIC